MGRGVFLRCGTARDHGLAFLGQSDTADLSTLPLDTGLLDSSLATVSPDFSTLPLDTGLLNPSLATIPASDIAPTTWTPPAYPQVLTPGTGIITQGGVQYAVGGAPGSVSQSLASLGSTFGQWLNQSTVISGVSNSTVLFGGAAAALLLAALLGNGGGKRRR